MAESAKEISLEEAMRIVADAGYRIVRERRRTVLDWIAGRYRPTEDITPPREA